MTIADQMPRTPLMRGAHRTIAAAIVALCAIWMFLTAGPAAAQEYKIRAGDTLQVEVLEDPSLNRTLLVLPDGTISFPLAGSVAASGRTVSQVQSALTSGLSGNFAAAPTVTVSVASLAQRTSSAPAPDPTIDVYIMGEVAVPGKKEIDPGTTILQFLAESGGLTPFAAKSRIELHRTDSQSGTTQVYFFSYDRRGKGERIASSTALIDGDVVVAGTE